MFLSSVLANSGYVPTIRNIRKITYLKSLYLNATSANTRSHISFVLLYTFNGLTWSSSSIYLFSLLPYTAQDEGYIKLLTSF